MIEAVSTSETSVSFYETKQRNIPEDNLHSRRRENLKSNKHTFAYVFIFYILFVMRSGTVCQR
jgi:hypothetical protein